MLRAICNMQFATGNLQCAICNVQFAMCNLQRAMCNLMCKSEQKGLESLIWQVLTLWWSELHKLLNAKLIHKGQMKITIIRHTCLIQGRPYPRPQVGAGKECMTMLDIDDL